MNLSLRSLLAALALSVFASAAFAAAPAGFKEIFNGRDLTGWKGDPARWSVRDGAITGQTTAAAPLEANTFLIWQDGQPANFELRLSFRLTGQNDQQFGNSGIQYRSKLLDAATFVVAGYQADLDLSGKYAGMLYEEKGRGILMTPGEKIRVTAAAPDAKKKAAVEKIAVITDRAALTTAYKIGEWNEFTIIAEGNHLRHYLNGVLTADVTDDDAPRASTAGVLALQLHKGTPMTIQFKNVILKTLP